MNDVIKGIGASEGCGIGRVMIIKERSLDYSPKTDTSPALEKQRLDDALSAFCRKTQALAERMRTSVGEKESKILLGHITMAQDPYMISEIKGRIDGGDCAEAALEAVCDMFIGVFSSAEDELTKQRAADVRDIKKGMLRILLGIEERNISLAPENTILVVSELTPSMTAGIVKKNIAGIITETGGSTSHSAIIARAMEIPAVLSIKNATSLFKEGDKIIVDGSEGIIITDPGMPELDSYTKKRAAFIQEKKALNKYMGKPTLTADGEKIELFCNIGKPEEAASALEMDGEGIGLFRTEFMFMDRSSAPGEDEQFEAYKKAALIMKGRPVTIRTLDVGGDKNIPYLNMDKEENPFLGFRGIRYCLKNQGLYMKQLRAILRASAYGDVRILVPMITSIEELIAVKELLGRAKEQLRECSISFKENIKLGVMIETPAAVMIADKLARDADFFSIGTNDLIQYLMAVDRGNPKASYLYSAYHPAVLRAIAHIISCAEKAGISVGMCGEAAADERLIPLLISFGLKEFSVSPTAVLKTRKAIASWSKAQADALAKKALSADIAEEAEEMLRRP